MTDALNGRQAEVDHPLFNLRREVNIRNIDVGRTDRDSARSGINEITSGLVEIVFNAREHCRKILNWIIRFEECSLVTDIAVAKRVTLIEGVVSKVFDDIEELLTENGPVSRGLTTLFKLGAFFLHEGAFFFAARLS